MKKILTLALIATTMLFASSCGEDDPINLDAPILTPPSASSVQVSNEVALSFTYAAAAGFKNSSVTATGGTAAITTDGTAGSESGTVTVTFTAGATVGAGSVILTVTDNEGDTQVSTAVITISASAVPTIAGITTAGSTTVGQTYSINDIILTAEDGFDTWRAEIVGGDVLVDDLDISAETSPYTASFSQEFDIETLAGTIEVEFTLTDGDGDVATFTQVLTLAYPEFTEVSVSNNITTATTWTADKIYVLTGKIFVESGAVLTINKGTIIKGQTGQGTNASGLYAARGGKIEAVGTATQPIIFTTVLDDIFPGRISSPNLDETDSELWGGVVLLGKAPISVGSGTEAQIEGVPASEPLGLYGGADEDDDSGELQYVSIRHGGTTIDPAAGKDINGLTLGGVGRGTVLKNIEVIANLDDGIEFFGGTVNISNVIIALQGDDGLDVDQAYTGTISNFMLIQSSATKDGLEIDGPEGALNGQFTIKDGTIKSLDGGGRAATFKSKAMAAVSNVLWTGYDDAKINIRASYTNCTTAKSDSYTNLTDATPTLIFTNVDFGSVSVYTDSDDGATPAVTCTVPAVDQTAAEGKIVDGTATGASDATVWNDWTLSHALGLL